VHRIIGKTELEEMLSNGQIDNDDPELGIGLVNVLPKDQYDAAHIPGSANIPFDEEAMSSFERMFLRSKELIVYSRSEYCPEAPRCAEALSSIGFEKVRLYAGGMREWGKAETIERGPGVVRDISID
jgi:rhodanese-related sulfurtransferase